MAVSLVNSLIRFYSSYSLSDHLPGQSVVNGSIFKYQKDLMVSCYA